MCSSRKNSVDSCTHRSWSGRAEQGARGGRWSGINIAAMVIGFVFFWPVGLAILFWIYTGRDVQDLPGAVREQWGRLFHGKRRSAQAETSDNVVFNDYQQTQYDRIREIKEEISSRAKRFSDFRQDAKRRADQEEFDRFMASGGKAGASDL